MGNNKKCREIENEIVRQDEINNARGYRVGNVGGRMRNANEREK